MKNTLVIYFQGGIGNQLFQFSMGYILSKKNNMKLKFCVEGYKNSERRFELNNFAKIKKFNFFLIKNPSIKIKILRFILRKFVSLLGKINKKDKLFNIFNGQDKIFYPYQRIDEISPFTFNSHILKNKIKKNSTIIGYYQSEKYFLDYRKEILKILKFPNNNSEQFKSHLEKINKSNSVAIHFRRGDYLSKELKNTHNVLSFDYYQRSIDLIKKKLKKPNFFIFTDDMSYIKNTNFIKKNKCFLINTESSYQDLHLMSKCKHFIIANSSFSWWGAWLSLNKKKIVCAPNIWTKTNISTNDLIPKNWIKIKI